MKLLSFNYFFYHEGKRLRFLSKDETFPEHYVLPQMSNKAEPSRTGLSTWGSLTGKFCVSGPSSINFEIFTPKLVEFILVFFSNELLSQKWIKSIKQPQTKKRRKKSLPWNHLCFSGSLLFRCYLFTGGNCPIYMKCSLGSNTSFHLESKPRKIKIPSCSVRSHGGSSIPSQDDCQNLPTPLSW